MSAEKGISTSPRKCLDANNKRFLNRSFPIRYFLNALAARKLNDSESKPWAIECAIHDAISKAEHILEKIDERWPTTSDVRP